MNRMVKAVSFLIPGAREACVPGTRAYTVQLRCFFFFVCFAISLVKGW